MYTIVVKRKGHKDLVRTGVDKFNAIIIKADLEMQYEELIKKNLMKVIVKEN